MEEEGLLQGLAIISGETQEQRQKDSQFLISFRFSLSLSTRNEAHTKVTVANPNAVPAAAEPSSSSAADDDDRPRSLQIESLHLIDFRQLSQSELYALSLTSSPAQHRCQDDAVIPKIDRSVFNESAGSRKQTFSRLRLVPRGKQPKPAPPPPASAAHIPLDEENSKIIEMLQKLFGVEALRNAARDGGEGGSGGGYNALVPLQVEFKPPESNVFALQTLPICHDAGDGGTKKRKRGRPRKNENSMAIVPVATPPPPPPPPRKKEEGEGCVDPVWEEVKRRTAGLENEAQVVEFLEGLKGEWNSQRKKKMTVEASEFGSDLPDGWKILLSVKKRAGRASVVCRRYVSPYGRQFESFKEVTAFLLSFCGEDINLAKPSYTDDSLQLNINVPSGSVICYSPAGDVKTDAVASCLSLPSTSVDSHHEKQASVPSSIEREKLNTLNGNSNSSLAGGCKLEYSFSGAFDGIHNANSVRGCSTGEDGVLNQKTVDTNEASGAASNQNIPLVLSTTVTNNNCGINQHCDEMNSLTCISNGVSDFPGDNRSTGCHESSRCGNAQTLVDNNGHGVSLSTCTEGASDSGGVDIAPNLSVANTVNDNHDPPTVDHVTSFAEERNPLNDQNQRIDYLLQTSSKCNLLTPDGEQSLIFDDNLYNISGGSFDAGFMEPQLGLGSRSNDVAVDAYANASIMQGCESVALGSGVLHPFDKQSNNGVNNANISCLSENAKSEQVDILQTNPMGMPDFR
ncbi:methyl-CpG-binding domain-containing protein [Stylosanthes scabra]|uniref:Methyl-CpG-binding domain-containing protein n=1 Tax=Stylosanthes scabra TaxID=79078 RepID=A0ABU6RM06_9FABA|nr:methyl-CpG-binding domain-containing protein [Stylosanthes scabra]